MISKADLESYLPLSESTYLILLSLGQGPRHGYLILKDVASLSGGRVQLSTGTLYSALKRLLADGWICRAGEDSPGEPDAATPGRRRRYYQLTDPGRRLLDAEITRLRSLLAAANVRRGQVPA